MSLEALLANDSITVQTNVATLAPDGSGGIPLDGYADLYTGVPARLEDAASSTGDAFNEWGQVNKTTIYTQQTGIAVKHLILTTDGRKLVVDGVNFRRGIGGMPDFYKVECTEYRPGA